MRFPFMLFVSFLDFLLANDMKFSVFVESDRKLKLRITSAAAENRELLQHYPLRLDPAQRRNVLITDIAIGIDPKIFGLELFEAITGTMAHARLGHTLAKR